MLLTAAPAAIAVEPGEMLNDPALEARAREISKELRCLVCQNQSIDDSSADLARDLRLIVRQRLTAGDSDDQVLQYVTDRYGDFVLLRPPVKPATLVLWLAPPLLLIAGAVLSVAYLRRRQRPGAEVRPLSPEERQQVDALLKTDSDRP
ncbi:MAG TPA: cytochrome c-type biogenesis protein [Verrucomicrobiae bacterium]|nr:cytochrome c-type biogenesis protein [Verrucomicrobiae bacterium]